MMRCLRVLPIVFVFSACTARPAPFDATTTRTGGDTDATATAAGSGVITDEPSNTASTTTTSGGETTLIGLETTAGSGTTGTETSSTSTTGSETSLPAGESTYVYPDPPPCGVPSCGEGKLCVEPGKICIPLDSTDSDGCNIDTPECYDDEPGAPSFCADIPPQCEDAVDLGYCLGDVLCDPSGCGSHTFKDGVLSCGPTFCHCP